MEKKEEEEQEQQQQQVIDFFKQEISSENTSQRLEALRHTKYLCAALSHQKVREEILPLFNDLINNDASYEVMCCVAEVLPDLSDALEYQPVHYTILVGYFYRLLSHEDSVVRSKAEQSAVVVLNSLVQHNSANIPKILRIFSRMVCCLGKEKIYSCRTSACSLSASLYKLCDAATQQSLLSLFRDLCYDDVPMVQKRAALLLREFIPALHKSLYESFVMMQISYFWKEQFCEDVRSGALTSCIFFMEYLSKEENLSFTLPLLLSAAQDPFWKIRFTLASHLDQILTQLDGQSIPFSSHLSLLLDDPESRVLCATLDALGRCISSLKPTTMNHPQLFHHLNTLASHPHELVRCALPEILVSLAKVNKLDSPNPDFSKTINLLLNDSSSCVKLRLLHHGEAIMDLLGPEQIASPVMETVASLMTDPQRSVRLEMLQQLRFLAKKLIQNHQEYRKTLENLYFPLLYDHAYAVRATAANCIEMFSTLFGQDWVTHFLLTRLFSLYYEEITLISSEASGKLSNSITMTRETFQTPPSYLIRMTVLNSLPGLVNFLQSETQEKVYDLLRNALQDPVPNIRFTAIRVIGRIISALSQNTPFQKLLTYIKDLREKDTDQDVVYYASEILAQSTSVN